MGGTKEVVLWVSAWLLASSCSIARAAFSKMTTAMLLGFQATGQPVVASTVTIRYVLHQLNSVPTALLLTYPSCGCLSCGLL